MLGNCFSKIIIKKIILRVMRQRVKYHPALWTKLGTSFNGHTRASLDSPQLPLLPSLACVANRCPVWCMQSFIFIFLYFLSFLRDFHIYPLKNKSSLSFCYLMIYKIDFFLILLLLIFMSFRFDLYSFKDFFLQFHTF